QMRRPAAVLVDGEFDSVVAGKGDEALAFGEVEDEGFLGEDVFACLEGGFHDGQAVGGVGGDVHHVDAGGRQGVFVAGGCADGRVELGGFRLGAGQSAVGDGGYFPAGAAVGVKMGGGDAACADQADSGPVGSGHRGQVGQRGGGDFGELGRFQRV